MSNINEIYPIDLEETKDKVSGARIFLEVFSLSEVVEDKYSLVFNLLTDRLSCVETELSNTIAKLQNKGN